MPRFSFNACQFRDILLLKYIKGLLVILIITLCTDAATAQKRFITRSGHQFSLNNKPYYYIGTNYWYGGLLALQKNGKERLKKELDFLKSQGVNNLRVLVGTEGKGLVNGVERVKPAFQFEQGEFNMEILGGLDFLLYEMGKRKMYAILFLSNNWEWSGGFLQYLNWNGVITDSVMQSKLNWDDLRENTSKFYSCEPCQKDYEKQLRLVLNHVNKYTKQKYIDEPSIMAWELANEPRPMRTAAVDKYKQWTSSVAKLIKSIDHNHLVTLGTEGIMGTDESADLFKEVHQPKEVDYLTIHIWPKNWGWFKDTSIVKSLPELISKTQQYIRQHEEIANELNKPLVVEEFGLPRDNHSFDPASSSYSRDKLYDAVFAEWAGSRKQGGVIAGCNFWAFAGTARPVPGQIFWKEGDDLMGDPPQEEQGLNSVFDSDNITWKIIRSYTLSQKSIK
ncbi:mannan endo-1,4-beta-mannosidase [Chitinophaga sp. CF118]|uniref:glycoside hydrolase 5 family protein n=1 Tax=Chitinophaga sp. CF118 TaxID=1884367 RepID=UPI0008F24E8E|nr:cellulase family glycosylhydrolase [Chitinophaga sp. CF118]SFD86374.1 mannan endo-1,4-beta-mannosidase [Chitinophaga sp. CF118]